MQTKDIRQLKQITDSADPVWMRLSHNTTPLGIQLKMANTVNMFHNKH